MPEKAFIQEYNSMNALIDPILAAGFHPLCPYHWVKYGFITVVTLLSIFALLGIKNKYAQALVAAGIITVATSPTWVPFLMNKVTPPAQQVDIAKVVNPPPEDTSPSAATAPLESRTQHLLFALGASTETTTSCYIINLTEGKSAIIEAPIELRNAKTLHLHWDEERDLIFAIAGTASDAVDLYQIDPDSPAFVFIATLMDNAEPACSVLAGDALFASKEGSSDLHIAEYDLNTDEVRTHAMSADRTRHMYTEILHCTDGENVSKSTEKKLPEHWTLTSKPARGNKLNGTYASVFDQEEASHAIIWLDGDLSVEIIMETIFPIQAMGVVFTERD